MIYILNFTLTDDVQEAFNLIQDLVPTTPQVILSFNFYIKLVFRGVKGNMVTESSHKIENFAFKGFKARLFSKKKGPIKTTIMSD